MRISDWSSDVCSSDLCLPAGKHGSEAFRPVRSIGDEDGGNVESVELWAIGRVRDDKSGRACGKTRLDRLGTEGGEHRLVDRSEEHTSELQSLMRISYAVFYLKTKNITSTSTKSNKSQ